MARGRDRELTKEEVREILSSGSRPVWTAAQVADKTDVSKTTSKNRLQELTETGEVDSVKVGNATAYYIIGVETQPNPEVPEEERVVKIVKNYWEGRLIGGLKDPSVALAYDGQRLRAGDEVQMIVHGTSLTRDVVIIPGEEDLDKIPQEGGYREELRKENEIGGELATVELGSRDFNGVKALISAELGSKFAVPVAEKEVGNFDTHAPDLEDSNTEWKFETEDSVPRLQVAGVGAYLLRPCENAVYLRNVEVVDIELPKEPDNPLADTDFHRDMELEIDDATRSEVIEFEDLHDE